MRSIATGISLGIAAGTSPAVAQQDFGPWRMHDWGFGWGGMWLGPIVMLAVLALLAAGIVSLVRWMAGNRGSADPSSSRSAREILDERYARGDIDRDEYLRRREDLAGRS